MTVGTSPEDARTRRIVADVVSNTLAIAMERAGSHGNVFGHMMSVLDEAKAPIEPETPPADERVLRDLITDGITTARGWRCHHGHLAPTGLLLYRLAVNLSNEMLDAQDMRARLANLSDRASDAIIRTIDARLARLAGHVAPDESHPADGDIEALKDDLVNAVAEALR